MPVLTKTQALFTGKNYLLPSPTGGLPACLWEVGMFTGSLGVGLREREGEREADFYVT